MKLKASREIKIIGKFDHLNALGSFCEEKYDKLSKPPSPCSSHTADSEPENNFLEQYSSLDSFAATKKSIQKNSCPFGLSDGSESEGSNSSGRTLLV